LEVRVTLERFLERMTQIGISEAEHGPPTARRYDKVPTYLLNGVTALHIEFEPRRRSEARPNPAPQVLR